MKFYRAMPLNTIPAGQGASGNVGGPAADAAGPLGAAPVIAVRLADLVSPITRVRNRPGVARGPVRISRRPKIRLTWSGHPALRLSRMTCSKNTCPDTGRSSIWVRENSACKMEMS